MNARDGSDKTQLTNNTANDGLSAWSPDGTKIAFTSQQVTQEDIGNVEIYTMNSDGSNQINITNSPTTHDTGVDWGIIPGTAGCTIVGTSGKDVLNGTEGDDVICGLGANDTIYGLGGNDTIYGGTGEDTLVGGPGADKLYGERSNDTLDSRDGVKGNDRKNGGVGTDTCLRDQRDTGNSCEKG